MNSLYKNYVGDEMKFLQIGIYVNDISFLCYAEEQERRNINGFIMQFSGYQRIRCEFATGLRTADCKQRSLGKKIVAIY